MMIFGTQAYGSVDKVPGLFHVETNFFHVNFVPLFPTGSYLILDGVTPKQGVKITLSLKSVLMAWFRGGLIAAIVGFGILALVTYSEHRGKNRLMVALLPTCMALGAGAFYWASHKFAKASRWRAYELADHLGIAREVVDAHFSTPMDDDAGAPAVAGDGGFTGKNAAKDDEVFRIE